MERIHCWRRIGELASALIMEIFALIFVSVAMVLNVACIRSASAAVIFLMSSEIVSQKINPYRQALDSLAQREYWLSRTNKKRAKGESQVNHTPKQVEQLAALFTDGLIFIAAKKAPMSNIERVFAASDPRPSALAISRFINMFWCRMKQFIEFRFEEGVPCGKKKVALL